MSINTLVQKKEDIFLSVELPDGKTSYLLCDCCEKYIKKTEMTLFDYAMTLRNCPTCYVQQIKQAEQHGRN